MGVQHSMEVGYACVSGDPSEVDDQHLKTRTFLRKQNARQPGDRLFLTCQRYITHTTHLSPRLSMRVLASCIEENTLQAHALLQGPPARELRMNALLHSQDQKSYFAADHTRTVSVTAQMSLRRGDHQTFPSR